MRDAELVARGIFAVVVDGAHEHDALAAYRAMRDTLSTPLFDVTDVIAGHCWTDQEIPRLLLQLSAAMGDELEALPCWLRSHRSQSSREVDATLEKVTDVRVDDRQAVVGYGIEA